MDVPKTVRRSVTVRSPNARATFTVFSAAAHQHLTKAGEDLARRIGASAPTRRLQATTLEVEARGVTLLATANELSITNDRSWL